MKKKFLIFALMLTVLACIFAISVSAATEPDASKGTVTLEDGTVCPLYDTNSNALIWYKSTKNTDDGYASLDFIRADSGNGEADYEGGTVYFKATYSFGASTNSSFPQSNFAITLYEVSSLRIVDKNGNSFSNTDIVVFNGKDDDVKVNEASSDSYLGKPVNCIKNIFWAAKSLEFVYLNTCTAALQANAINGCDNLRYVNLEELVNLRQIDGGSSLGNNPKLFLNGVCDLTNTAVVKIDGAGAMANNKYKELLLPETLRAIGNYVFEKNPNLTRVVFTSEITSCSGQNHFYNCTSLTTVEGFENLKIPGVNQGFFENCPITSITIPETATSIDKNAFMNTKLKEIVIPNGVTKLGQNAFKNCSELTTVKVGKGVTTFGGYDVFNSCPKLTTIYLPGGITGPDFRNMFFGSNAITTVYYIGSLDELNAFCALLETAGNGTDSDNSYFISIPRISYDAYSKLADKSGAYIIYDYSACDAYFDGKHVEKLEEGEVDTNLCVLTECVNCSWKNKYIGNDSTHIFDDGVISYANGFALAGTFTLTCQNAGCVCNTTPKVTETPAIYNCLGFAVKEDGTSLTLGYAFDKEAYEAYIANNAENIVSFGFVAYATYEEDSCTPLSVNEGVISPVDTARTIFASMSVNFAAYDFVIRGFDETTQDFNIAMCAYTYDGNNVKYLCKNTEGVYGAYDVAYATTISKEA